eukprot:CAMPEP_0194053110 /NCGR_PEP_ID=MMETSP0009_2-20130614/48319_1 /TAXON_ID=210454 /ORGANISM="Grammatophora oceanica, Strain CCMP 410" /LENGTH=148 /DNA_ID=CAMNT_0038701019 /DNA_START=100 /DNA_END=547 /DNA_ORIENTATION=+
MYCLFDPNKRAAFDDGAFLPADGDVTGTIYSSDEVDAPTVRLFTKEGCTLCDKVKDVLTDLRTEYPHNLEAVDITDDEHADWFSKYKYDIPVLHVGSEYWAKHRISERDARDGLNEAKTGTFLARTGEPDAGEMERKQAERLANESSN